MRVAIIDLGTNSVRFDVHQFGPKDRQQLLHREKLMVRLGQGVFATGKLNREAIRRTVLAFQSFQKTAQELRVDRVVAFGTAALREAGDGLPFLEMIKQKTGIEIQVISGAEEARLIALGILKNERRAKGRYGLIDIGGGSTEITICRNKESIIGNSFSLGTAKLQQVFLKGNPPRPLPGGEDPIKHLRRYIRTTINTKILDEKWPPATKFYGSSGTIRSIARLLNKKKKNVRIVERNELKKLVKAMSTMTPTELLNLPGMEAKRIDMILSGAVLLDECMSCFKVKEVIPTEFSLRDGIVAEQFALYREQKNSSLGIHLKDLEENVGKLYKDASHVRFVAEVSAQLFHGLKRLHKLGPEWLSYLEAAAWLHDVGEIISPTRHEHHSYYFAKNGDYAVLDKWEREFVGQLCLHHRGSDLPAMDFDGKDLRTKKRAFELLLSILRVADSLDRSHTENLEIKQVRITRSVITIDVSSNEIPDLEILRFAQKKALFEKAYGRTLSLNWKKTRTKRRA